MEKLLEIPWDIPKDKWINDKYNIESADFGIAEQKIAIQL